MCDRPSVRLGSGEIVWARVNVHDLDRELEPGEYSFATVFGAVGSMADSPPARIAFHSARDGNLEIYVMEGDGLQPDALHLQRRPGCSTRLVSRWQHDRLHLH